MLAVLRTWGRVLIMHGPALVAAYVIGHTAHYILIWVSGFVGAYSSFALVLVAPLAVLSKLLAFVAMMLITRDSLPHLSAAAPTGEQTLLERRVGFSEAVLSSVIPFFAFYYAAGFFREDLSRILTISQEQVFAGDGSETGNALQFEVNPSILALLLGCFVLKQVWEKAKDRLPSWTRIPAVYLDVVWVLVVIYGASAYTIAFTDWVQSRAVVQWAVDLGDWVAVTVPAVAAVWEVAAQVVTTVLNLSVISLAWLLIAGVVFGEAIAAQRPAMAGLSRVTNRLEHLAPTTRRRLRDTAGLAGSRIEPILQATTLLIHAGPIRIAFYLLLSQVWLFADQALAAGIPRLFGPHEWDWWVMFLPFIALIPAMISEPIRIALIAAAYDDALGAMKAGGTSDAARGGMPAGGTSGAADDASALSQDEPAFSQGEAPGQRAKSTSTG